MSETLILDELRRKLERCEKMLIALTEKAGLPVPEEE